MGTLTMVVTLKNGVQIRTEIEKISTERNQLTGDITALTWTPSEGARSRLHYVDLAEVSSVHTEKEGPQR